MILADIGTNVLAIIKLTAMAVFLHVLWSDVTHNDPSMGRLVIEIGNVGFCHILSVIASTTIAVDHRELLGIEIVFRVRSKPAIRWLHVLLIVVSNGIEVGQLFLGLTDLISGFLLVGKDARNLFSGANLNFRAVASHFVGVLTILRKRISKITPNTRLSQGARILLLKHIFLFSKLSEPVVFESSAGGNTAIRIVNKKLLN